MSCRVCGSDIPVRSGRVPKFCSGACRQRAYRARRKLPVELTSRRRWCARVGKRPVRLDGRGASSTDSATWSSYEAVRAMPHGIMLGDGLACWDLDGVLDGGQLHPEAARVLADVGDGALWVERSLSGRGLHVFVHGGGRSVVGERISYYAHSRFIAVTGDYYTV